MTDAEARAEYGYARVEGIERLREEVRRLRQARAHLRALAEAALAYDAAIQRQAVHGKQWVEGDALDGLYERWLGLAREALERDGG